MGRGGTSAREIIFVSLVAYGPNSDSALTMGGLQPLKPGRAVPNIELFLKNLNLKRDVLSMLVEENLFFARFKRSWPCNLKSSS